MSGYAEWAPKYWSARWAGVLPLPAGKKTPPPSGWTGYQGTYPSWPDIQAWIEEHPDGNLGLRLPNTVVGIDVDNYGDKGGFATLQEAERRWGVLPPTVRSTARLDGKSGIRLFRVPAGTELETVVTFPELGLGGIEVVQFFHRYCVAWPSIHPETGTPYRWLTAEGYVTAELPKAHVLPDLPQAWIEGLRRRTQGAQTADVDVANVLSSLPPGGMTLRVQDEVKKAKTGLLGGKSHESRHDSTMRHVLTLLRFAEQGDSGVTEALEELRRAFVASVGPDRGVDAAGAEFDRMVTNERGHGLIAATPTGNVYDLAGERPPLTVDGVAPKLAYAQGPEIENLAWHTAVVPVTVSEFDRMLFGGDHQEPSGPASDFDRALWGEEQGRGQTTTEPRTSWGLIDLEPVLSGDYEPPEATKLIRTDGKALCYPGKINALVGEAESGKSWVGLLAIVQEINAGGTAIMIDFEDSKESVVARLRWMGLTDEQILHNFGYVRPTTPLEPEAQNELFEGINHLRPGVILADGVNAAMNLQGLKITDNNDATTLFQIILRPLADTGATVITVDHVTKDKEGRGAYAIGAQAKRAMGEVVIGVECVETFGRGKLGKLQLLAHKDKYGAVREVAEKRKNGDYIGTVTIDSRVEDRVLVTLSFEQQKADEKADPQTKYTIAMMRISKYLVEEDPEREGIPKTTLRQELKYGNRNADTNPFDVGLGALIMRGDVKEVKKGRSKVIILERPFTWEIPEADAVLFGLGPDQGSLPPGGGGDVEN